MAGYARSMIREWGMGSFKFNVDEAYTEQQRFGFDRFRLDISSETAREIELEIKALVDECMSNVRQLLSQHKDGMKNLAEALVEKETLSFRDIARILEPKRSEIEIERDLLVLAEKKLVGKVPVINLNAIKGLLKSDDDAGKTNGKSTKADKPDKEIPPVDKDSEKPTDK